MQLNADEQLLVLRLRRRQERWLNTGRYLNALMILVVVAISAREFYARGLAPTPMIGVLIVVFASLSLHRNWNGRPDHLLLIKLFDLQDPNAVPNKSFKPKPLRGSA